MTADSGMKCGDCCASAQKSGAVWKNVKYAGRLAGSFIVAAGLLAVVDMATGKAQLQDHVSNLQSETYHLDKTAAADGNTCYYFNPAMKEEVSFRTSSMLDDRHVTMGELPVLGSAFCGALQDGDKMTLAQARQATAEAVSSFTASVQVQSVLKKDAHTNGYIDLRNIPVTPASGLR